MVDEHHEGVKVSANTNKKSLTATMNERENDDEKAHQVQVIATDKRSATAATATTPANANDEELLDSFHTEVATAEQESAMATTTPATSTTKNGELSSDFLTEEESTAAAAATDGEFSDNLPPEVNAGNDEFSFAGTPIAAAGVTSAANDERMLSFSNLPPGAYRVRPSFANEEDINESQNSCDGEDDVVFLGFLPEPTPEEIDRRQAEELLRSAITLPDWAVRPIATGVDAGRNGNSGASSDNDEEGGRNSTGNNISNTASDLEKDSGGKSPQGTSLQKILKSPISFILLTLSILAAIALGVAFGGSQGTSATSCISTVPDRYNVAKSIISEITPQEILEDAATPQNKALEWIACQDGVSSKLIDNRDPATGLLPKQANGFKVGGDTGESQVLRRYALAAFYFATTEHGPWSEMWNFLSPDTHECGWHKEKNRGDLFFAKTDPAGFVCTILTAQDVVLDDTEAVISYVNLNFRIPNNLTGTIPPEFGYIEDITYIGLENQRGLYGSLPDTIGNPPNLHSLSILFAGPDFGGMIPPSLFAHPSLKYISFNHNEGALEFPLAIPEKLGKSILLGLNLRSTGLFGTIPSFISEHTSLTTLDLSGNDLEGSIPDSIGNLTSIIYLDLHNNNLKGTLPRSLGQMSALTAMVLGKNNFEGPLPQWLNNLKQLRLLDLSYNKFEGEIPATFSQLSSLENISLQHNGNLNGSISALEGLDSLSSILLYSNNFSSTIPVELFSNSAGWIFADLGHNNFTGKLPPSFSHLASNTSYLSIMGNNFDADAVDGVLCEQVNFLFADCSSCPCCISCCEEDSASESENDHFCNFDVDFYNMVGLKCGAWWSSCFASYGEHDYDPLPVDG